MGKEALATMKGRKLEPVFFEYQDKEVILYALGLGVDRPIINDDNLMFLYENHANFQPIPTFCVNFPFAILNQFAMTLMSEVPEFNPMMLLHGEQYLELISTIPTNGKMRSDCEVEEVLDKGKAALLVIGSKTFDTSNNQLLCYNRFTLFLRGMGGFAPNQKQPPVSILAPPNRAPDAISETPTVETQAALYRLSGDRNPLHLDPSMAAMGGFEKPILHGLCSFGIAAKSVLSAFCNNDGFKFKSISARFSKHVFPGETIITEMWKESNKVFFVCKLKEREGQILSNCVVELREEKSNL